MYKNYLMKPLPLSIAVKSILLILFIIGDMFKASLPRMCCENFSDPDIILSKNKWICSKKTFGPLVVGYDFETEIQ